MAKRLVYLRVGDEPVRGPLDARSVVESVEAGVLAKDAEVSDSKEGTFVPVAELASQLAAARGRALRRVLGTVVALALLGGGATLGIKYHRSQPEKLCEATPRLLTALPSQLAIDAYVTRGTPKLDTFAKNLEALLRQYEAAAPNKVTVRVHDGSDEAAATAAREAGLMMMPLGDLGADPDAVTLRKGYSGIIFKYGAAQETIKYLPPESASGLEFWVTSKIREIHAREDHAGYEIAVATGHGESPLRAANLVARAAGTTTNLQTIMEQNFPFYAFADTDLTKGPPAQESAGLLLTQPTADFTDEELSRIDDYVMKGHSLVVAASSVNVKASDPTMTFALSSHGLGRLLASYGIRCTTTWSWISITASR